MLSRRTLLHWIVLIAMAAGLFGCAPQATPAVSTGQNVEPTAAEAKPTATTAAAATQPEAKPTETTSATTAPAAKELEGEISFQFWMDVEQAKAGVLQNTQWQAAYYQIKEWEKLHPKVKINWISDLSANDDDRYNNMRTALINKTLPDIVSGYPVAQLIKGNKDLIFNLKDYLQKPNPYGKAATWLGELPSDYSNGWFNAQEMTKGEDYLFIGDMQGLPTGADAVFYNIDAFEAAGIKTPPTTWKEFMEDSQKILDAKLDMAPYFRDTAPGRDLNWDMAYVTESVADPTYRKIFDAWQTSAVPWAATPEMLWWAYEKKVLTPGGPEVLEAARIFKEWSKYWNEDFAAVQPGVNYLLTKRVAMVHDGIWMTDTYLKGAKEAGFRVGSFPMPVIGSEVSTSGRKLSLNWAGSAGFGGGTGFFIPKTTASDPNKLAIAVDLLQYLSARPQRDAWCAQQMPPCLDPGQNINDIVKDADKKEALRGFLEFTPTDDTGYFGFWLFPTEAYKKVFLSYVNDEIKLEDVGKLLDAELKPTWDLAKAENKQWNIDKWPEPVK